MIKFIKTMECAFKTFPTDYLCRACEHRWFCQKLFKDYKLEIKEVV